MADGVAYFHKQWGGRTPKAGGRLLDSRSWAEPQRAEIWVAAGRGRHRCAVDELRAGHLQPAHGVAHGDLTRRREPVLADRDHDPVRAFLLTGTAEDEGVGVERVALRIAGQRQLEGGGDRTRLPGPG